MKNGWGCCSKFVGVVVFIFFCFLMLFWNVWVCILKCVEKIYFDIDCGY